MKLVIAEKPSVAKDLAAVLGAKTKRNGYYEGNQYQVTWCIGHLIQLANPEEYGEQYKKWSLNNLPILPETFKKEIASNTKKQFEIVKHLIQQHHEIICATDAGREGQLIFEYVYQMVPHPEKQTVKRLWISSMTDEAIQEGFQQLKDNSQYQRLYESARCRSEADWLVGMNFTRLFTIRYGTKLTVGRVQTPTLALLVERHQAIQNFQSTPYFQLEGIFGKLKALYYRGDTSRLTEKQEAETIRKRLLGKQGTVTKLETTRKTEDRPLLFDLTELQRESNRRYGYTAQETLGIAQNLYEKHKLITYPRTDSRYLTADMKPLVPVLLQKISQVYSASTPFIQTILTKKPNLDKRVINDSKVSDHHAIIVTNNIHHYQPQKLTVKENHLLQLIMTRFITAFAHKKQYDETKLEITVEKELFKATGRTIVKEGWAFIERSLLSKPINEEENTEEIQILSGIKLGQQLLLEQINLLEKKTTPPKPYTEATLLTAMEKASREIDDKLLKESLKGKGLGTPATRAGIIEKLISVGYAERNKKHLVPTTHGITFIALAPPSIRQVELTAQWEHELQQICDGKGNPEQFMNEIRQYVQKIVAENTSLDHLQATYRKGALRRIVGKCPKCGSPVIESERSFYCDGFRKEPKCNFSLWKENKYLQARGITLTADLAVELLATGKMQINQLTSKSGNTYNAIFYMEPGEQYVNFRMEFAPRIPAASAQPEHLQNQEEVKS